MSRRSLRRLTLCALGLALAAVSAVGVTPHGSSASAATPAGDGWNLVFADEFDSTSLDESRWHTCHWWAPTTCTIETNKELELYTPANVSVGGGALKLQARKQNAVGWNGKTYGYTSGMVSTGGSMYSSPAKAPGFVFTYGYVEAKVKVPAGKGLWPAVWLLPDSHSWPPEIDIMEIIGDRVTETNMHYHYNRADGTYADVGKAWTGPDFSAGWHTFGVDWQPGSLTWYVDGVERFRFTDPSVTAEPSYLLLNLAVGGNWPGAPDASTVLPADYLVDYVHVYQRDGQVAAPVPATDTAVPNVEIDLLSATGSSTVSVTGKARDNVAVTKATLSIDGSVRATSSSGSVSYNWNTKKVARGSHTIVVKAWDAAGNVGSSTVTYRK